MSVHQEVTLSNPDMLGNLIEAHEDLSDLLLVIGVTQIGAMADRLFETHSQDDEAYRTGNLERSLQVNDSGQGSTETIFAVDKRNMVVGSGVPYAAMQDVGGRVLPRTVKYLAVPCTRAVKSRAPGGLWPRDFGPDDLEFRPNTKGTGRAVGWLFDANDGALGLGMGPLFSLLPWVDIPAKGLSDAAEVRVRDEIGEIYAEWFEGHANGV